MDDLVKGKGNGSRKAYNHLSETGIFGVAERIAQEKKGNPKFKKHARR